MTADCSRRLIKKIYMLTDASSTVQVLVFNCDGDFDFRSMGRIFIGLVKCGAWGCFDEFNRLEEGVLSAVSQQVQLIQVTFLLTTVRSISADQSS